MAPVNTRARLLAAGALIACLGACSDSPNGLDSFPPTPTGLIASDPVLNTAAGPGSTVARSLSDGDGTVYVTLLPGTVPGGRIAEIHVVGSSNAVFASISEGGFDPVPIIAGVGDSIEVVVTDAGGAVVQELRVAVAALRPPIVVRTEPPPRKRDQPLNAAIVVVFSEPVAGSSLTASSVEVFQGVTRIAGSVSLLQGTGSAVAFIPDVLLNAKTDYRLVVTRAVKDLQGDALKAEVTVPFTTGLSSTGPAASITVSPDTVFLSGATYQMTATVRDAAGNQLIDQPVTWSTDGPAGLTVSSTGLLTGLVAGGYHVTAAASGLFAEALVFVTAAGAPATLTVWPTQATVGAAGDTIILTATVRDAVGRLLDHPSVIWSSSDPSVARAAAGGFTSVGLAFGTVTGGSTGSATITATSGSANGTVSVTTVPPLPVASLTVTPAAATVILQGTAQLSATVQDESGKVVAGRPITWTTDKAAVATVSASGLVKGISEGSTAVVATIEGFSDTASITVTSNQILFTTARDGNWEIYLVNMDGSGLTNLTNSGPCCGDFSPAWSPKGAKIAFLSQRPYWNIYVMNADGSGVTPLTGDGISFGPVWSPDATRIAFLNDRDSDTYEDIWVMNADGSNPLNLTNTYGVTQGSPAWSPDGTKIAFLRGGDVFVMNADGSHATNVTNTSSAGEFLDIDAWSPDGTKILFLSYRDGNGEIYVMNADGSSALNLTNNPARDDLGSWSPDGTKIIFVSDRDANQEIYVMNVDGSGVTRLTNDPAADYCPRWSPDGTKVLFENSSDRSGNSDVGIYVMNADGSGQVHLTTNHPGSAECPTWRPR